MSATIEGFRPGYVPSLTELHRHAVVTHHGYPQYAGYFDGWVRGKLTHDIRHRGRGYLVAKKGTWVLLDPKPFDQPDVMPVSAQIYVPHTASVSLIDPAHVVEA